MNIDHMRAFLEVAATGSFQTAADRLNVTQSTVSARIKVLEERLDRILFHRRRTGAEMTAAGKHFHRYAVVAVRAWEQARQEIALPDALTSVVGLGVHFSLWDRLCVAWVDRMRAMAPDLGVNLSVDYSEPLTRRLLDGFLDLAVLYVPQQRPNLVVELLMEEALVMVSTVKDRQVASWSPEYIYTDWGPDFRAAHSMAYPDSARPNMQFDLAALTLDYILSHGGTSYFLEATVAPYVARGELFLVEKAPVFRRPAYLAYPEDHAAPERLEVAIRALREIVNGDGVAETDGSAAAYRS